MSAPVLLGSVVLEPPLTHCGTWRNPESPRPVPLLTGPRFVRGAGNSRWHRPRSGVDHGAHTTYRLWCGQTLFVRDGFVCLDILPKRAPLCGTCDGRAVGAGQDAWRVDGGPELVFTPERLTPPRRCPGSRTAWCEELSPRVGRCYVCGSATPMRVSGGPYNSRWGMTTHEPGPDLVAGCPFHAWRELVLVGPSTVICGCQREREVACG